MAVFLCAAAMGDHTQGKGAHTNNVLPLVIMLLLRTITPTSRSFNTLYIFTHLVIVAMALIIWASLKLWYVVYKGYRYAQVREANRFVQQTTTTVYTVPNTCGSPPVYSQASAPIVVEKHYY